MSWSNVISSSIRRARGWKVDARFLRLYRPLRQAFIRLTGGPGVQPWTLTYPRRRPLRAAIDQRQFFT
jgi:hypothetical protein